MSQSLYPVGIITCFPQKTFPIEGKNLYKLSFFVKRAFYDFHENSNQFYRLSTDPKENFKKMIEMSTFLLFICNKLDTK